MRSALFLLFGGLLIGAGLVVQDEILTLAIYCGGSCLYPYPLLGALHLYDAEIVAFLFVIFGLVLFCWGWLSVTVSIAFYLLKHGETEQKPADSKDYSGK